MYSVIVFFSVLKIQGGGEGGTESARADFER